ncbi:MAG: serine hydrolase domain-containing protein [Candidatus Hodarchaeota archaeon]
MSKKQFVKQTLDLIDNWLDFQIYMKEIPGVAVGIFMEDEVIFKKEYGYANLETRERLTDRHLFRIASHSKLFTATAIMKLYYEEKLSIDDRVSKYLPWFTSETDKNMQQIRIRHLLSHSSGITRDGTTGHWIKYEFPDKKEIINQVKQGISFYQTNEHLKYSNFGYTLLGQIIEVVSGLSYEQYMKSEILDPLNMKNTIVDITDETAPLHALGYKRRFPKKNREKFGPIPAKIMQSATGFSSTVKDLITFYRAHIFGNNTLFPDYIKREMQRVHFQSKKVNWGLGFSVNERNSIKIVEHGGGYPGYITFSAMIQDQKLIIVVLTNAIDGPAMALATGIMALIDASVEKREKFMPEKDKTLEDFSEIIGFYNTDWATTLYSQIGNKLVSISPQMDVPTEFMMIYNQKAKREFIIPPDFPTGSPGQTFKFLEKDGEIVIESSGSIIKRFEFNY